MGALPSTPGTGPEFEAGLVEGMVLRSGPNAAHRYPWDRGTLRMSRQTNTGRKRLVTPEMRSLKRNFSIHWHHQSQCWEKSREGGSCSVSLL